MELRSYIKIFEDYKDDDALNPSELSVKYFNKKIATLAEYTFLHYMDTKTYKSILDRVKKIYDDNKEKSDISKFMGFLVSDLIEPLVDKYIKGEKSYPELPDEFYMISELPRIHRVLISFWENYAKQAITGDYISTILSDTDLKRKEFGLD